MSEIYTPVFESQEQDIAPAIAVGADLLDMGVMIAKEALAPQPQEPVCDHHIRDQWQAAFDLEEMQMEERIRLSQVRYALEAFCTSDKPQEQVVSVQESSFPDTRTLAASDFAEQPMASYPSMPVPTQ